MDIVSQTTVDSVWRQQVRLLPSREFLVFVDSKRGRDRRFTYAEFDREVGQTAAMLAACGVRFGDRVGVWLPNCPEFIECLLALARLGAVLVPFDATCTPVDVLTMVHRCDIKVLVKDQDYPLSDELTRDLETVVVVGSGDGSDYAALKARHADASVSLPVLQSSDLAQIMFTSGTESQPKGVMLTQANMVFAGYYVNWEMQMIPEDRYFTSMAVNRVNLQLSALMPVITAGATLILLRKYSASRMWKQVLDTEATLIQSMPMIIRTLMKQPAIPGERDHHVRAMHHFLPLTDGEKRAFVERFGIPLVNNYGSSETLVGVITDLPMQPTNWPSIGKVGLSYEVKIVDEEGADVPIGGTGEIYVRGEPGRNLMLGYWENPQATSARVHPGGWFQTGDFGYEDKDGWIYFVGRGSDLIKRAGENISAIEVEDVLMGHPDIEAVAVLGIPDAIRDEAVKAVVVRRPGSSLDAEAVIAYATTRLARYKVPTVIEFRGDLPRGAYGKVLKQLLREEQKEG